MTLLKRNFLALILAVSSASAMAQTKGKVRIVVSVDWEGHNLSRSNLDEMIKFRNEYPEVPLQHFLNAAYYTKPNANARQVTRSINEVLRDGDEHGLHVHAWRSLVQASGVQFKTSPSFYRDGLDLRICNQEGDCGNDIPLVMYSEAELRKIIKYSSKTLVDNGFRQPKSFRAGGWMADSKVLNALADSGFTLDSSATDAEKLKDQWSDENLYSFVAQIWPKNKDPNDKKKNTLIGQPYVYQAPSGAKLTELPNNGCLADYQDGSQMLETFEANAAYLKSLNNSNAVVYLSIGFHQETAAEYLPHVKDGIDKIIESARKNKIAYEFVVAPF